MSEIEIWIEEAATNQKISIRKLHEPEASHIRQEAMSRFVKETALGREWWLNLAKPIDEHYDLNTVKLSSIMPTQPVSCWLFPEVDLGPLPVY